MTVYIGQTFYGEFDSVPFQGDTRLFDDGMEQQTAEASAGGDAIAVEVATMLKATPKLKIVVDSDAYGLALAAVLKIGHSGNLIWGPRGNTAGMPKWGLAVTVKKASDPHTYNKELEMDVEWYVYSGSLVYDGRTITF
jgi:hypothetical protein